MKSNTDILKTSIIRKQPRKTRKHVRPYFKNPLKSSYDLIAPIQIKQQLLGINYISMRGLDSMIKFPNKSPLQILEQMKYAVIDQQTKIANINNKKIEIIQESRQQSIETLWKWNYQDQSYQRQNLKKQIDLDFGVNQFIN